jgi:hypothetical protein
MRFTMAAPKLPVMRLPCRLPKRCEQGNARHPSPQIVPAMSDRVR